MGKPLFQGNTSRFEFLLDTDSYIGHAGEALIVTPGADGITYSTSGGGGGSVTVYADIASRPLTALDGEGAIVSDATADPEVGRNIWALYFWSGAEWKLTGSEEDVLYSSSLSDGTIVPNAVGGIPAGTTMASLRANSPTDLWDSLLFPIVQAWIGSNLSGLMSGVTTATIEVGTIMLPTGTATFDPGLIKNGDGSNGPTLVGDATSYEFKLPTGQSDPAAPVVAAGNTQGYTFILSYNIQVGSNRWSCIILYDAGTGNYQDSAGNNATNLDGSRVAGSLTVYTNTITGRYYFFYDSGALGSAPINSAGVRSLSKSFLDGSNEGVFNILIPANTPEVYFYTIPGKTIVVNYVESLNADVTGTFTQSSINVDDAGGNNVTYESWVAPTGGAFGYPTDATYKVTIT